MSEGDGVEVKRLFPLRAGRMNFDPFVLWDNFFLQPGNGFPDHPHRGFEAITYLFSGSIKHTDNLGNQSTVTAGGAQRFTAGKGLVHSEMPAAEGISNGIQLWINLPKRLKSIDPDYQQADATQLPTQQLQNGNMRIIVGEGSPVKLQTPVRYLGVQLQADGLYEEDIPPGQRGFVYIVEGDGVVLDKAVTSDDAVFFDDLNHLSVTTTYACHFMVCYGQPHGEPIKQYGPYVD